MFKSRFREQCFLAIVLVLMLLLFGSGIFLTGKAAWDGSVVWRSILGTLAFLTFCLLAFFGGLQRRLR